MGSSFSGAGAAGAIGDTSPATPRPSTAGKGAKTPADRTTEHREG